MTDCIFCKIVNKEINSDIVDEDDSVIIFKDINPKAEIHLLIVPKEHIESIQSNGSEKVAEKLILKAKQIAKEKGLEGYRLVFNVGKEGGQTVNHLHLHFLAGKNQLTA